MKKILSLILLLCMILTLAACGKVEITMQEICDAGQIEALLQNHQSVSVQVEMDGIVFAETYETKEYTYVHYPDEEFEAAQFMTDELSYSYNGGEYLRYLYITSDGVTNDFASDRAEFSIPVIHEDITEETISSVSEKDGRIVVNSILGEEALGALAEEGISSYKAEYVLDAKTREPISTFGEYTDIDGAVYQTATNVTYDEAAPEMLEVFLKYANQTEDLRNVTIVNNPGTGKEISQDFQIPRGLILGFTYGDAFEDKVAFYSDAACTESYDPFGNTDADITVYVKWSE